MYTQDVNLTGLACDLTCAQRYSYSAKASELYRINWSRTEIFISCVCLTCSISPAKHISWTWTKLFIRWVGGWHVVYHLCSLSPCTHPHNPVPTHTTLYLPAATLSLPVPTRPNPGHSRPQPCTYPPTPFTYMPPPCTYQPLQCTSLTLHLSTPTLYLPAPARCHPGHLHRPIPPCNPSPLSCTAPKSPPFSNQKILTQSPHKSKSVFAKIRWLHRVQNQSSQSNLPWLLLTFGKVTDGVSRAVSCPALRGSHGSDSPFGRRYSWCEQREKRLSL